MPKGSEELTNARKEEIIDACASLYETKSFRDITIRDIGEKTSFTRTSIYNYYHSKEEIFLALLRREHEAWTEDLNGISRQYGKLSAEEFADKLARSLEKRGCMLKLMSMNIYDMEVNSRLENLVEFKRVYAEAFDTVGRSFEKFFPSMTKESIRQFLYAFFPFLFGVHPYTCHTEKQLEAMRIAGVEDADASIYELAETFVFRMLKSFGQ